MAGFDLHTWMAKMRLWFNHNVRDYVLALKQGNITFRQLPYLIRERRLWLQVMKNFRELEGSWIGAIRRNILIFKGHPHK